MAATNTWRNWLFSSQTVIFLPTWIQWWCQINWMNRIWQWQSFLLDRALSRVMIVFVHWLTQQVRVLPARFPPGSIVHLISGGAYMGVDRFIDILPTVISATLEGPYTLRQAFLQINSIQVQPQDTSSDGEPMTVRWWYCKWTASESEWSRWFLLWGWLFSYFWFQLVSFSPSVKDNLICLSSFNNQIFVCFFLTHNKWQNSYRSNVQSGKYCGV